MRFSDVKVGEEYAHNAYKRQHSYSGRAARVKVLEVAPYKRRYDEIRGFKVKLLKAGYTGPTKVGATFVVPASELTQTWADELKDIARSEQAGKIREVQRFRELVAVTHLRIRLAARGFGHYEWGDNKEDDYYVSSSQVRFDVEQMHAVLTAPSVDTRADAEIPLKNVSLPVRRLKKKQRGDVEWRMYHNGIPVTDGTPDQAKVREVRDVLTGKKPLPEVPTMEEE